MTTTTEAVCPACGTRNRVPVTTAGHPRCAKCHADLPWLVNVNQSELDDLLRTSSLPVLVDLWAPWCGPCRTIAPILVDLATERAGSLQIAKVNVDESPGLTSRMGVRGIPTMVLYHRGNEIGRQVGALPGHRLREWVDSTTSSSAAD
jgi:thioredoxin 2